MPGAVAAGHPQTAAAGAEMLRLGGNAFDAAIAAVLTACVTESALTSLGGGGFLLAHTPQEDLLFDFFTQTPDQQTTAQPSDFYPIDANFGNTVQEFHVGLGAIAVPGLPAGLAHVHRRLGRLPLAEIAAPAIHWARTGVTVDAFQSYCYQILDAILTASPAAREIYAPSGKRLKKGDRLRMPALADTLEMLVKVGFEEFYRGDIGHQLVQDCQVKGGYLTQADLQNYRVIERQPLRLTYRNRTLLTNPPPSSGGALIAFCLNLLSKFDFSQLTRGSPAHLRLLSQAMKMTNEARRDGYDARLYEADVAERFLADGHVEPYRQALAEAANKWGSTTHISVIDSEGNAASVTTSNGEGSSYVIPGTQIMANNMLGEEDLNPQGFHQWQPNQRISSMMAPTMLLQSGQPQLVLGSGGSNRIRTAILQVISNLVDFNLPLAEAVSAPRIHWEREIFNLEPGFDRVAIEQSNLLGSEQPLWWPQANMFFGGVHSVGVDAEGQFQAAGDERRDGAIAIV